MRPSNRILLFELALIACLHRYLRELYANPSPGSLKTFMPSVIACLLKNLTFLEVLDMEKLHDGIEDYYHNASIACSRYDGIDGVQW